MADVLNLRETYLEVAEGGAINPIPVTPDFWPDLIAGKRTIDGRLLVAIDVTGDTDHWEMHPEGEELFVSVSATVDVVLSAGAEPDQAAKPALTLEPGQACLVPRGAWHRWIMRQPGRMVVMTWGAGTRHHPIEG